MKTNILIHLGAGMLAAAFAASTASAQNVGIGTSTPKSKLSVNGTTAAGGIAVGDATYTSTTGTVAPLNGALIQGFTGIGTINPLMHLHVEGNGSTNLDTAVFVNSLAPVPTGNAAPMVILRAANNTSLAANQIYGRFIIQSTPGGTGANSTGLDAIHRGFSGSDPLTAIGLRTVGAGGSFERVRIDENGNVGIGDSDPTEARLVVRGAEAGTITGGRTQFSLNSAGLLDVAGTFNIAPSIYASSAIVAEGNLIAGISVIAANTLNVSDSRLKNIVRESNSAADLNTLQKIRITDYTMKDPSVLGAGEIKKVIAQQVEEVYPRAVTKSAGYLPDIQSPGTCMARGGDVFEIKLGASHHLAAGTRVKLMTAKGDAEYAVVETSADQSFTAKLKHAADGEKVFVYGRQIDDLRTVDYDALSMLNISATQELAKKAAAMEEKGARQDAEIAALKAENARLKAQTEKLATLSTKMESLEKLINSTRPGGTASTVITR
ncbi:MAG TPA: tail fiber domain-containing protein [Verrucomicrobiales bacterium]|nr:tail fiber domain-containing protein [Verrucomicrobiales bacterium]